MSSAVQGHRVVREYTVEPLVTMADDDNLANVVFHKESSTSRLSTAAFLWDATPRKVTISSSSSSKTQRRPRPWNDRT